VQTFNEFISDFKRQFYPENAIHEAKSRLRRLKQTGSIRDYVKEFTSLTLEIPDLSDDDALFYFLDGLSPRAKMEIRGPGVRDLADTIAEAESIAELHEEATHKEKHERKSGGEKRTHEVKKPSPEKWKGKEIETSLKSSVKCFLCDGPHRVRECPKKAGFHAMEAQIEKHEDPEDTRMGSLSFLNAVETKEDPPKSRPYLQFVNVKIKGSDIQALVDTGATHNFIAESEAKRLGVRITKEDGSIKAVNSDPRPIQGVAKGVRIEIGSWSGTVDLTVVPMDDFQLVLGMDFFDEVQAFPIPFSRSLCIVDGGRTCLVNTIKRRKAKTISALQLVEEARGLDLEDHRREEKRHEASERSNATQQSKSPDVGAKRRKGKSPKRRRRNKGRGSLEHGNDDTSRPTNQKNPTKGEGRHPTQAQQGRDEGVARLAGGGCHVPPRGCPEIRNIPDQPRRWRKLGEDSRGAKKG
jgi:hypothetical protein